MQGKIVMITGATNGIGREAALKLAALGAHVIVHGRSPAKVDEVVGAITRTGGRAEGVLADLSQLDAIRGLAATIKERYPRLDVLLNNAGAVYQNRETSADGYEMTFAVNHLSYFLLTNLLLDTLKASAPARIVNVSSDAHKGTRAVDFTTLGKRSGAGFGAYAESKLFNLWFTFELARRLKDTGVTVNALHPGFVSTGFGLNNGGIMAFVIGTMMKPFARKPEDGAQTSIYLASSPAVAGVTGKYFANSREAQATALAHDEAGQRRLWDMSAQMTGLTVTV